MNMWNNSNEANFRGLIYNLQQEYDQTNVGIQRQTEVLNSAYTYFQSTNLQRDIGIQIREMEEALRNIALIKKNRDDVIKNVKMYLTYLGMESEGNYKNAFEAYQHVRHSIGPKSNTPEQSPSTKPPEQSPSAKQKPMADLNSSKDNSNCSKLRKNISKSAIELNCCECLGSNNALNKGSTNDTNQESRNSNLATNIQFGVLNKTQGFFSSLKHRWTRARSKDGRKYTYQDCTDGHESTDYAADYSSAEHSSSATPLTQSPRHQSNITCTTLPTHKKVQDLINDTIINNSNKYSDSIDTELGVAHNTIKVLQEDEIQINRETCLRQHAFFQLKIHLISGSNLVAMDKNGTSDPYVKFKVGGKILHKSKTVQRNLNPVWDETFIVPIEDPFQKIHIKVFDYDWGLQDDFMGSVMLDLTRIDLGRLHLLNLKLEDNSRPMRVLGELQLNVILWPRTQEDKEQYFQRNPRLVDASKRLKSQIWSSVLTVVLVEARHLPQHIENSSKEFHVRFRLGNEKFKSKTSWHARWLEQFDLHLFDDDQILELSIWNRNMQFGKCIIDLRNTSRETTHGIWQQFEDCDVEVYLLLTISGTTASETITDLSSYREDSRDRTNLELRYSLKNTLQNLRDVGHLTVKVFGATGLVSADIGGKSDPFCVLELTNSRLQTQTEYKTLTPNWNKIFTFAVKDMTSVLEVTVFDEDRDHKVEFLGRVVIPLLRIHNGDKRWYTLKDKKMYSRAKGNSPQILLEMYVIWNPLRAAIRALEPKEEKFVNQEIKFKRQLFLRNVNRLKFIIMWFFEWARYVQSCFEWESPLRSIVALLIWISCCMWADISSVPIVLLGLLLKNWFIKWISGSSSQTIENEYEVVSDDDEDDDKDKEEKKTIKERLLAIQEVSQSVQNSIGYLASLGESIKNTFNFSVPEISWLAAILLFVGCVVLHVIPFRILLLLWGIAKFSRRLIRPHNPPSNEILDLLTRVPDDEKLITYRELQANINSDTPRRDPKKKMKLT